MCSTAKQKRDDISALLSAITIQLHSYYFNNLNCFSTISQSISQPIYIWNKAALKPDLCLMMPNNRRQHYTRYRQRQIVKYSKASRTYREYNRGEINSCQKNACRRNLELSRLQNENEYLREIFAISFFFF